MSIEDSKVVYVIYNKATKLVKIGVTNNVASRLNTLQHACGCYLSVEFVTPPLLNAFEIEAEIHKRFKKFRCFGEWFKIPKGKGKKELMLIKESFIIAKEFLDYNNGLSINKVSKKFKKPAKFIKGQFKDLKATKKRIKAKKYKTNGTTNLYGSYRQVCKHLYYSDQFNTYKVKIYKNGVMHEENFNSKEDATKFIKTL